MNKTRCARLARVPVSSLVRFPAQDNPCSRQPSGCSEEKSKVPSLSAHNGVHPREGKENPALILPPLDVSFGSYISIDVGNNNQKKKKKISPWWPARHYGLKTDMITSQECLLICLEIFIPCVLFWTFSGAQHSNKCSYIWSGPIFVSAYKLSARSSVIFLIMLISVRPFFRDAHCSQLIKP